MMSQTYARRGNVVGVPGTGSGRKGAPMTTLAREIRNDLTTIETVTHDREIAGRKVGDYMPFGIGPGHSHNLYNVVGYVVRRTVADSAVLYRDSDADRNPDGWPGYDTAAYAGPTFYGLAIADARRYRSPEGPGHSWAVVDMLYGCGCRGGR